MDPLDQIVAPAEPLLRRVDDVLTQVGAPADHPVWTAIRRVGLLPGDAVRAVAGLHAAGLAAAAPELRAGAQTYAGIAESLPGPGTWSGTAADAYEAARRRAADHLSGATESLDERLQATADLADALVAWIDQTRADVAGAVAEILTSAEAVTLSSGDRPEIELARAAGDVGDLVLRAVMRGYEHAEDLLHGSAELAVPTW